MRRATAIGVGVVLAGVALMGTRWDLHAYWSVNPMDPYANPSGSLSGIDTFRYAPPVVWSATQTACAAGQESRPSGANSYLIGGRWALALVLFPPVLLDIRYGNINIMLTAAVFVGFRHPGAWAAVLLTKVTPAAGLVWFAARRELRNLAVVAGVAALVSLPTIVLAPHLWAEWIATLDASRAMPPELGALPVPLLLRLVVAVALAGWGGLGNRRWTVPVAVTIAMPVLWPVALTPLVALAHSGQRVNQGNATGTSPDGSPVPVTGRTTPH